MEYVLKAIRNPSDQYSNGYYTGKSFIHQGSRYAVIDNNINKAKVYSSKARADQASNMIFENHIFEAEPYKGD